MIHRDVKKINRIFPLSLIFELQKKEIDFVYYLFPTASQTQPSSLIFCMVI